jgi:ribonuclease HI
VELCGIFTALVYLQLVTTYHHIVPGRARKLCTMYCDSKAALHRISDLSYDGFGTTWRCQANYDLEAAIKACLRQLNMQICWEWVKGHARRRKKPTEFTWAESLNDHADILATAARDVTVKSASPHWPEQQISFDGPRGRISGRINHEIRYCCTATDLLSYWQQRFNWSVSQVNSIDLEGTRAASTKMRVDIARRIQKLRCSWLPVNSREARFDPDQVSGCSACSSANLVPETVDHIFPQCTAHLRRNKLLERFSSFSAYFRSLKTSKLLIAAIQSGTLAWAQQREPPAAESLVLPENQVGELIQKAYDEQNSLGWNILFRGFWSSSWRLAQEEQFRMHQSRELNDTGKRWAASAQMWFFDTFEALWAIRKRGGTWQRSSNRASDPIIQERESGTTFVRKRRGSSLCGAASVPRPDRRSTSATGPDAGALDQQDNCVSTQSIPTTVSVATGPTSSNKFLRTTTPSSQFSSRTDVKARIVIISYLFLGFSFSFWFAMLKESRESAHLQLCSN